MAQRKTCRFQLALERRPEGAAPHVGGEALSVELDDACEVAQVDRHHGCEAFAPIGLDAAAHAAAAAEGDPGQPAFVRVVAQADHVIFRAVERVMRSAGHFWATLNYVHHNPVRHGFVERWTDWPWSSAAEYLEQMGRVEAERVWKEYPIRDYGKKWDDAGI